MVLYSVLILLEPSFEPCRTGNLCLDLSVQRNSCDLIAWG